MKKNYPYKILYNYNFCKKITLLFFICLASWQSFSQDSCAQAQLITAGTYTVDQINGTNVNVGCSSATNAEWYKYVPTQNHSVTVTSDLPVNICKDTNFYVYTGTCNGLTCYVGDDDGGNIQCNSGNSNSYLSTKTFDVFAGTTYYIAWDSRWNSNGFQFQLIQAPYVPSPCTTAIPVTAGLHTVDAIDGSNVNTTCSNASKAKWYTYTPTQD